MLWFSLRAFILVFSKYKYSLETSIDTLNNIWIRINYRKKSEKIVRNIKRLLRKNVYQVYDLKSTGTLENKVTWNEESKS